MDNGLGMININLARFVRRHYLCCAGRSIALLIWVAMNLLRLWQVNKQNEGVAVLLIAEASMGWHKIKSTSVMDVFARTSLYGSQITRV